MSVNAEKKSLEDLMKEMFSTRYRKIGDNDFKGNVDGISAEGMKNLLGFDDTHDILILRSGTGLVVIMTTK